MPQPNFFIVGSPKAGTSAMAQYLAEHANVFFSKPKEPFYWCRDFVESKSVHRLQGIDDYLRLFDDASESKYQIIAEGSTTYLQSRIALQSIREFNPDSKVLAMLRNPIDVVAAMHGELLRHGMEDQEQIEIAWSLQSSRQRGEGVPPNCKFPHQLQYRDVASYHDQIKRMMQQFPEDSRKIIFYEDFVSDTQRIYQDVLSFLGLEDDQRHEFPQVHASKVVRNRLVAKLSSDPPPWIAGTANRLKDWYYGSNGPMKRMLQSALTRKQKRQPLSDEFRHKLINEFRPDIEKLGELVGRDLSGWLVTTANPDSSKAIH
ncbi:sulfotransferase family protein [Rubripirellula obstinata]|uniref:sulfotransferase family protein n=1 Tax=Rubripirellula obstinata TaxID=406547 RepID=UPI001357C76B|nr:sulfotransferase [Rubripirellula obstinata]